MSNVIEITDTNIDHHVKKHSILVVDAWAVWCPSCLMIAPLIDDLATEMKGVTFGKVDVDKNRNLPVKYSIMSIPTMLVFKNGELAGRIAGSMPKVALTRKIEEIINASEAQKFRSLRKDKIAEEKIRASHENRKEEVISHEDKNPQAQPPAGA